MGDARIYKGGTGDVKYIMCDKDYPQFNPPLEMTHVKGTPPYDSHADGAYNIGYFTLGMPIFPSRDDWQYRAFDDAKLGVGDVIQCIQIPIDGFATAISFKCNAEDPRLAGATVKLVSLERKYNVTTGLWETTPTTTVEDAATAAGLGTPIDVSGKFKQMFSLWKDNGNGYTEPLWSKNMDSVMIVGIRIESIPTDTTVSIKDMLNDWYLVVKGESFDCPAGY